MSFSVIIPTMWKSKRTQGMLSALEASEHVKEIVLIDNDPSARKSVKLEHFKKLIHLPQEENIFVNPAWNLGYEKSTCEYLAILNDDINFGVDSVLEMLPEFLDKFGLIGVNPACYANRTNVTPLSMIDKMPGNGYGSAMFIRRDRYVVIPDELRIWFGDNWLFDHQTKPNFALGGLSIQTEMSTTVSQVSQKIIREDGAAWQELKRNEAS